MIVVVVSIRVGHIARQIRVIGLSLVVALDQCLAEIRIRTQVQRGLQFPVLDCEVCPVGGQEAGDGGRGFLVSVLKFNKSVIEKSIKVGCNQYNDQSILCDICQNENKTSNLRFSVPSRASQSPPRPATAAADSTCDA